MSHANAMAAAQRLAACLRARGVTVSIELQTDTRGTWDVLPKRGVLSHHTASYIRQGNTPLLALCKRGRASEGIAGPLCNGYGGRDLVYRIICMGKANHAGAGGGITLAGFVSANAGNSQLWGTEYEGGYESWDDVPGMREFMARANAGILDFFGWGVQAHGEHKTYAGRRKVDRKDYTTESGRNEIVTLGHKGGTLTPVNNVIAPVGGSPWAGKDPNAVYQPGSRTVRLYSAGTDVKFLQSVIDVTEDGYFGAISVNALKRYQRGNGLVGDGIAGPLTWGKVLRAPSVPNPVEIPGVAAPAFPLPAGWYFGPKSGPRESVSGYFSYRGDLKRWQQRMRDRGWNITVDGLYGDETGDIAELFQREKGLTVDRAIGPQTWAAAWTAPITPA